MVTPPPRPVDRAAPISPGRVWYWYGALLFVGAGIIAPVMIVIAAFRGHFAAEFVVPGTNKVNLRAGNYVLWNDYTTILNGTTYSSSRDLPGGIKVELAGEGQTNSTPMIPDLGGSVSLNDHRRRSIGRFAVPTAGNYVLSVSGEFNPRVFSLRQAQLGDVFKALALCVPVASVGWIGGPVILIAVALRRAKARRAFAL